MTKPLPNRIEDLSHALPEAEWQARIAAGLPPYHLTSWDHYPFTFALQERAAFDTLTAEWCRTPDHLPIAWMFRAMARIAFADWPGVNAALAEYVRRQPTDRVGRVGIGETPRPTLALPPVTGKWPKGAAFFLGCDYPYFVEFGLPLLTSFATKAPGSSIHVHLMGQIAGKIGVPAGINLTVTHEDCASLIARTSTTPRDYYAAVRLCRFYEAMTQATGPLCLLDTDALVNRDPRVLFNATDQGIALRARAGRLEPWNQLAAATVVAFPTPTTLTYLKAVNDVILGTLNALWWGMDQFALLSAMVATGIRPSLLGPEVVDVTDHSADALLWMTAGKAKFRARDAADTSSYGQVFRKYSDAIKRAGM